MRAKLPYAVECKSLYPFFETIAAFDCQVAAYRYAARCAEASPANDYRVMKGRTVLVNPNSCRPGLKITAKGA